MCGILCNYSNKNISEELFKVCLSKMSHRGPDDIGIYIKDKVALGHNRLSIIDLSENGHQPMVSVDDQYVIIFNGEIYNHLEIRQELLNEGFVFKSYSDTEVILNGYVAWKEKILEKLNGMFSFIILNKSNNALFIARDRSGIKPLYFFIRNDEYWFSSELKGLPAEFEVDEQAKIAFLLLGYIPDPFCIYKNISSFPSGHYGTLQNGKLSLKRFDSYSFSINKEISYTDAVKGTKNNLENAINSHLTSDAPVGVFLSGGLDSSILTAIAATAIPGLHTVSLTLDDDLSEGFYQDLIVKKYKTQHHNLFIDKLKFRDAIPGFLSAMEQPTIDGLNSYLVSKAAKEVGLKTVLSGIGADELFYGYPSFRDASILKKARFLSKPLTALYRKNPRLSKFEFLTLKNDFSIYLPKRGLFTPSQIAKLLEIDIVKVNSVIDKLANTYKPAIDSTDLDKIGFWELELYMKNQLLRDADVFSMTHSLEVRTPFLDKKLIDFSLSLKSQYKFGKHNKQLLIDAFSHYLPLEIITRPKKGFTLPYQEWLTDSLDFSEILGKNSEIQQMSWPKLWAIYILNQY